MKLLFAWKTSNDSAWESITSLLMRPGRNMFLGAPKDMSSINNKKHRKMNVNFIDLGLPSKTKWADRNYGAKSPEDPGTYLDYEDWNKLRIWDRCSKSELYELIDECNWEWTNQNEMAGFKVTGPNGNSIFIPASGYYYQKNLYKFGESTELWSCFRDGGNLCLSLFSDEDFDPRTGYSSSYYKLPTRLTMDGE